MAQFPLQDQPLSLPSGRIVRVYNLLALDQSPGPSFLRVIPSVRIQYATELAPEQSDERFEEAVEVLAYFVGNSGQGKAEIATVEICENRAQAEMREPAGTIYKFERAQDRSWRLADLDG